MASFCFAARVVVATLFLAAGAAPGAEAEARTGRSPDPSHLLFSNGPPRHLRIEIAVKDLVTLRAYRWRRSENPEDRPSVPCTVREGSEVYTNVAIHLKGGFGSFRPVDLKPGLTLNFSKFAAGQRFYGLQKISLNNSVQDPSYAADKLCRELFAKVGVPVPRAHHATVELNGEPRGLYVLTEGWDKSFLKRHFGNTKGNLYDPTVATDINQPLRVNSGENPDDHSALKAAVKAASERDPAKRIQQLEQRVDVDRFLTMLALDVMLWNWDGYAMNKNNYRVFHDLDTGRLVFMPHGMDQMFWRPEGPIVTGRNGCIARGLMGTAEGRRRYLERFAQLRTNLFDAKALTNRVGEIAAQIRPFVARPGLAGLVDKLQFDRAVNLLRNRIGQRARSIDEQLAGVRNLTAQETNRPTSLTGWKPRVSSGNATLDRTSEPPALHLAAKEQTEACWLTTVCLEEGRYRIEGRIKTRGVNADRDSLDALSGAGLRVWSNRKVSNGTHWEWFPYRESRDFSRRGELVATDFVPRRFVGTRDWTGFTYEIELHQPMADLEVRCELHGNSGEAWFDLKSLTVTRLTDVCP